MGDRRRPREREDTLGEPERAAPGPRGTRGPWGGPSSRRLARQRRSRQPHSSGFPTHSPSKSPQSPSFSRAPPPPGLEKLFFTPSWSLICCAERKQLLLGEGLRGGRGGGAGDCVSRSCAPEAAGGGGRPGAGRGERGAGGEGLEGRPGPEWGPPGRGRGRPGGSDRPGWGPPGRGVRRGGPWGVREWKKRPPARTSPLSSWPCCAPGREIGGRWTHTEAGTGGEAAHPEEVMLRQGATALWGTHRTCKTGCNTQRETHSHQKPRHPTLIRVPHPERGQ